MSLTPLGTGEPPLQPPGRHTLGTGEPPLDPQGRQDRGTGEPPQGGLHRGLWEVRRGEKSDVDPALHAGAKALHSYLTRSGHVQPPAPARRGGGRVNRGQQSARNWLFTLARDLDSLIAVSISAPSAIVTLQGNAAWTATAPGEAELERQARACLARAAAPKDAGTLAEVIAQATRLELTMALQAGLEPDLHDRTVELLELVSAVVAGPLYRIKQGLDVRRPSVVTAQPDLPWVPVPGHASFPSGHATTAHALATVLIDLLGAGDDESRYLEAVAERLADNRIAAGLHTEADTEAGKQLGQALGQWLLSPGLSQACPRWGQLVETCRKELT